MQKISVSTIAKSYPRGEHQVSLIRGVRAVGGAGPMAAQLASGSYDRVTQKWRDLAERRRAHFVDLQQSGRWRHYYTREQFEAAMREVVAAAEAWARIAPRLPENEIAA